MPHDQSDVLCAINELKDSIANLNFRLSEQDKKINNLESLLTQKESKYTVTAPSLPSSFHQPPAPPASAKEKLSDRMANGVEGVLTVDGNRYKKKDGIKTILFCCLNIFSYLYDIDFSTFELYSAWCGCK